MRFLKWAALIAVIVAVIATIAHLRRDAIATGIARSILSEQGFEVIDLSVDKVATDRLDLARLVIRSKAGTEYTVIGLSMPVSLGGTRAVRISAEGLFVTYGDVPDEPEMLGTALHTALEAPLTRPGLKVAIAQVSVPNLPELGDLVWTTAETGQDLSFTVGEILVAVGVVRGDGGDHTMAVSATHGGAEQVLSADIGLTRRGEKYRGSGAATIQTGAWLPVVRPLGLIPAGLERLDAELEGPIEILFDESEAGRASFTARFGLVDSLTATFRSADDSLSDIGIAAVDELGISIDYPSLEWTARAGTVVTVMTAAGLDSLPAILNDLECRAGTRCTMRAVVDAQSVQWNGYNASTAKLNLPLTVDLGEATRIGIASDATGKFTGVRMPDFSAGSVSVTGFSGTRIVVEDDFWYCRIDELRLAIERLSGGNDLVTSFPITLNDLDIRNSAGAVDTKISVPPIANAAWGDMTVLLPGFEGTASIRDERLTSSLKLKGRRGAISASLGVALDLSADTGSINVTDARVSFDRASLSELAPRLPFPVDIVDGTWDGGIGIQWQSRNNVTQYSGSMQFAFDGLAGRYNDIAFVGLTTKVGAKVDSAGRMSVSPSTLAVRLVDIGLPLEYITASYTINADRQELKVSDLSISALGGTFVAAPFDYSINAATNLIPLQARSVQLQLMVDLLGSDYIEMSGSISGDLPVTIGEENMTIDYGRLRSDPPGGVIRYRADNGALAAAVPDDRLSLVTRALSNFKFDLLTSDVDYNDAGDLKLRMRLSGINPDMDATQPIILNLSVEDNVPQLLRSLQATRSIEDILEKRAAKKAQ